MASRVAALHNAALAGCFGALASVVGKLSVDSATSARAAWITGVLGAAHAEKALLAVRALIFSLTFLCNFFMWGLFSKALSAGDSTIVVSLTNNSANYLATAVLGVVVFQELLSWRWYLGAALMALGTVIIARGQPEAEEKQELRRSKRTKKTQ